MFLRDLLATHRLVLRGYKYVSLSGKSSRYQLICYLKRMAPDLQRKVDATRRARLAQEAAIKSRVHSQVRISFCSGISILMPTSAIS